MYKHIRIYIKGREGEEKARGKSYQFYVVVTTTAMQECSVVWMTPGKMMTLIKYMQKFPAIFWKLETEYATETFAHTY